MTKNNFFSDKNFPINFEQFNFFKKNINLYTPLEISWLSGYLWGLISKKNNNNIIKNDKITIISSSQTGNAHYLSKKLYDELLKKEIKVKLFNVKDYKFRKISEENILIIITSTQGDGEPPEEAFAFYNYLHSKKIKHLKNIKYAIFGLGDKTYEKFCQTSKDFDKILFNLGAKRIIDRVDSDIEFEKVASDWRKKIIKILKINKNININKKHLYSKKNPFKAKIISKQKITGLYSNKNIQHIEIDLLNSKIKYNPGDALGIIHKNDPKLVDEILKLLNIECNKKIEFNNNFLTHKEILINNFELLNNTIDIVEKYTKISNNKKLLKLLKNKNKIKEYVKKTPIIEMLYEKPIKIEFKNLIKILRPLKPRLYSISSSQLENENEVHITVNVIKYKINNHIRYGSASSYISNRLNEDDYINIFIQENKNFKLPKDNKTNIIMIGAGTGIAPFRSFIQQRNFEKATGKNWLFFGNQHFTEDFLYQSEWQKYFEKSLINKISLAWSRDQKNKIYIQNKILENGLNFWKWIKNGSYIYICGDANNMAKDVEKTIIKILSKYGKMNYEKADKFLINMRLKGYYQKDIY
ncbi:assimilatory sulfite reductase (NADPH) flavoprotein subunit [Enterobacterales bacterium endosymbiont of Anomoneura mori]|uniref:assimilatory sulfite reductase (NADPH) flavoprotein subunit n=1 Tax=Enterobacterales bacterium endosymbiont of Anomoneura mori TaxID=3132096 RepID=UPI00399D2874